VWNKAWSGSRSAWSTIIQKKTKMNSLRNVLHIGYIFIYFYAYILKKNMQNARSVAENMKTYIFLLLVDKDYNIIKLEMPSVVD
jgi:hypothetical protein